MYSTVRALYKHIYFVLSVGGINHCLLVQHPFIRDATDVKPVIDLLAEANAEVILEERDADDIEIKVDGDISIYLFSKFVQIQ